jgi:hypothetical protein
VTASGDVTGTNYKGIYARNNNSAGSSLTVSAAKVTVDAAVKVADRIHALPVGDARSRALRRGGE